MEPALAMLVIGHLVSTVALVGIIWTVQVVHYPLMAHVGEEHFVGYASAHAPRMAAVVMIPWTVQGVTTAGLLLLRPDGVSTALLGAVAVAALTPVVVTVVASVPAHRQLASGFQPAVHRRLVRTNWLRTAAWTAHLPLAVTVLLRVT